MLFLIIPFSKLLLFKIFVTNGEDKTSPLVNMNQFKPDTIANIKHFRNSFCVSIRLG